MDPSDDNLSRPLKLIQMCKTKFAAEKLRCGDNVEIWIVQQICRNKPVAAVILTLFTLPLVLLTVVADQLLGCGSHSNRFCLQSYFQHSLFTFRGCSGFKVQLDFVHARHVLSEKSDKFAVGSAFADKFSCGIGKERLSWFSDG